MRLASLRHRRMAGSIVVRAATNDGLTAGCPAEAALFVLFSATTRAGIVAAYLRSRLRFRYGTVGFLPLPDGSYLVDERATVIEKAPVSCTQVVQTRFAVRGLYQSILRAFTVAHFPDFTFQAIAG